MTDLLKLAIIGSGPAGLSAASRAAMLGMSHILLEKTDHLSDTIFKYQKGKRVLATPERLDLRSDCRFAEGAREVILANWDEDAAQCGVNVAYQADVTGVSGQKGDFTLTTADGRQFRAEHIVLAIGTQGNPNRLRCEGYDLPHIIYQVDDPEDFKDKHITVVGSGDAGIENALGVAEEALENHVTILNRSRDFARAKAKNVSDMMDAADNGLMRVRTETQPKKVEAGWLTLDTPDGEERIPCDVIVARLGSVAPRAFVESMGIEFTGPDREAFPKLSPTFETSVGGIFVIGALAGYPLIKHCMNQGYDVAEFINGNDALTPADEKDLAAIFADLPQKKSVSAWLEYFRQRISIFHDVSPLQMREFMLDSRAAFYAKGEVVFEKGDPGSSLFAIADGFAEVEVAPNVRIPIEQGSIFGEVGLISGRKRGATIVAGVDAIFVEVTRTAALKLMAAVPGAKRAINRISLERQLLQIFKGGLTVQDLSEVVEQAEVMRFPAGKVVVAEGDTGDDIYVIRSGSMVVEKDIGGKPIFLRYLPAGSYFGEMSVLSGAPRNATVKAAVGSEVIKLTGETFRKMLDARPNVRAETEAAMAERASMNAFIESRKASYSSAVDLYSDTASFIMKEGLGEATDALLIDENLCVGCDNCEKACADSHEGLSRLDREAGKSFAHLHVPTSCRHCEHPHCMADCPPNVIHRGPDGEVFMEDGCIGCGNCMRNCPYGVIRMEATPPKKPSLFQWLLFGFGPGPGEPSPSWTKKQLGDEKPKKIAVKCDMCKGISGGPACVRACPTGAAIRVSPEEFLSIARLDGGQG
ncbi:cyclic nucleotide-binding domain-containing protein [Sphingopyxis yananensis]|uniref:cyclic nucleotide-binding domain-containing protein n=1 Tax=Sphingopyxis yananensis TaxID=2886687 RepID=UPI001D112E79|nr:cyclic nucleotide-binding domain-containing protein [Sphingopyxis yananensis]MCC2602010.1 cyclic nucleotide-binding domain-containing protein [Sphingopyxis yananensis]